MWEMSSSALSETQALKMLSATEGSVWDLLKVNKLPHVASMWTVLDGTGPEPLVLRAKPG